MLALNHDKFSIYNGRGNKVQPVDLPEEAPDTLTKALGEELTGGELNVDSYNGGEVSGGAPGAFHGHNEKSNEVQIDQENYFRVVDKYVFEHFSKPTKLPLVLLALKENIADFDKLSKNEYLDESWLAKEWKKLSSKLQFDANSWQISFKQSSDGTQYNLLQDSITTKRIVEVLV